MANRLGKIVGSATFLYRQAAKAARWGRWPLTMGVRILVRDESGRVLLVRHTYAAGWHFPGGAIDRRETASEAAARELREEALIESLSAPRLVGIYLNLSENKSDHILFFEAREWRVTSGKQRALEIAEARFFPPQSLPEGTTAGTRRRLNELQDGADPSLRW